MGWTNLNVIVAGVDGQRLAGAGVTIDQDFGNGTARQTGGDGFANFGVFGPVSLTVHVGAPGYGSQVRGETIGADEIDHWVSVTLARTSGPETPRPPSGGTIDVGYGPGVPSPELPPLEFDVVDGVPRIKPHFFIPPEVGSAGGPWIAAAVITLTFLSSIFGGTGEDSDRERDRRIREIESGLLTFGVSLVNLGGVMQQIDGRGAGVFDTIFGKILGPVINAIAAIVGKLHGKLVDLFGPVVKFLKRVRDIVRRVYDKWLRPILATIDAIRAFLRLLSVFHIEWAAKADAALSRLERKLTEPILLALRYIDDVLNRIDYLVDVGGLLKRLPYVRSMIRFRSEMTSIWWASHARPLARRAGGFQYTPEEMPPVETDVEELRVLLFEDAGPLAAAALEDIDDVKLWLRNR